MPPEPTTLTIGMVEAMFERARRGPPRESYRSIRQRVWYDVADERNSEAWERAQTLLKSSLTTEQLSQYEAKQHFEVIGSNTGKRYRINYGRQMNIDELDAEGAKVCGWCFLPQGGLVEGDVMLAQKIALECDETKALKVANRIDGCQQSWAIGGAGYMYSNELLDVLREQVQPLTRFAAPRESAVVNSADWTGA